MIQTLKTFEAKIWLAEMLESSKERFHHMPPVDKDSATTKLFIRALDKNFIKHHLHNNILTSKNKDSAIIQGQFISRKHVSIAKIRAHYAKIAPWNFS